MSSKSTSESLVTSPHLHHRRRRAWSLAARLTAWYAVSAFFLILSASFVLYIALARSLDADNDRVLADRLGDVAAVLRNRPDARTELGDTIELSASPQQHTPMHYRITADRSGQQPLASPNMDHILPADLFPRPVSLSGRVPQGLDVIGRDGRRYRAMAARSNPKDAESSFTIQAALSLEPQEKILSAYRRRLWLTMSIAMIACLVIGYEIARRGIRPVREITGIAQRIRSTTLDARIDSKNMPAEIRSLAGEFNLMLDRLQESFARISRFSADIAHELRTPVNNLRGVAEVALTKARSRDEYHEALSSSIEECLRLSHIIENLLFLARAEDPKHQIVREPIDVAHELATVAEFYEPTATEAGVSIDVKVDGEVKASLNRTLVQRAVGNLLDNSIKNTPAGGRITLAATRANGSLEINVADTGRGIPQEHLPRVFDRLYRVADDRSKNTGGTGLGLAIVKSIAASHGGSVHIESKPGEGTRVSIAIPVDASA